MRATQKRFVPCASNRTYPRYPRATFGFMSITCGDSVLFPRKFAGIRTAITRPTLCAGNEARPNRRTGVVARSQSGYDYRWGTTISLQCRRIASMSFKSETYRVLIASPSDLTEERQVATEAVSEWNAVHAVAESVVLLPVKWETHATPQSGIRPQEAINRQLVRGSDILVGMFWTRIGTSTGVADSGTVEEIDQFVAAGKPALLYFSSRPIDPNKIDLKQHRKLKSFKAATYRKALTGSFSRVEELRQNLVRDLMQQVREMKVSTPPAHVGKLDQASKITELILAHRKNRSEE